MPGGEMLLHASRLIVPREKHGLIDVAAPLPERFGDWRDAA
jgi:tRNA pseudouridine32 synthase/23S rRNA pseudouridine746 synthase